MTLPSAYSTLVQFVWALSTGDEKLAISLVVDPVLVEKAKERSRQARH